MTNIIQPLDQVSEADAHNIGGKAANLAKLIQNNLPVPNGFVVGLNAFNSIGKLKDNARKQIQELTSDIKLYAVRSSALAEDAKGASWAGQFETFLDTKPKDVLTRVEQCQNLATKLTTLI